MFCFNVLCFVFLFYGLCLCFRFFVNVLGFVIVFYSLCLCFMFCVSVLCFAIVLSCVSVSGFVIPFCSYRPP